MGRRSTDGERGLTVRAAVWAAAVALVGCSPQPSAEASTGAEAVQPTRHPVSGLEVIPLAVKSDGKVHRFRVELAQSPEDQRKGLMFRTELGPDEGMIFPSVPQTARSFWMKNTPLSLDIIFVGADGRILNIAARTEPYSLDPVYSLGVTSGVLELRGGRAAELGIEPGDEVEW